MLQSLALSPWNLSPCFKYFLLPSEASLYNSIQPQDWCSCCLLGGSFGVPRSPAVGLLLPPLIAKYSVFMALLFPFFPSCGVIFILGQFVTWFAATHIVVLACVGGCIQKQARRNGWQEWLFKFLFLLELPSCLSCCFRLLFHNRLSRALSIRSRVPQHQEINCSSGINYCCSSNLFRKCYWINFYKQTSD